MHLICCFLFTVFVCCCFRFPQLTSTAIRAHPLIRALPPLSLFAPPPGLDQIEYLQSHENIEIYNKAFEIIDRYFNNDEEQTNIAPNVDENNQQFTFGAPPAAGGQDGNQFNF